MNDPLQAFKQWFAGFVDATGGNGLNPSQWETLQKRISTLPDHVTFKSLPTGPSTFPYADPKPTVGASPQVPRFSSDPGL